MFMEKALDHVKDYKIYHEFVDWIDKSVQRVTVWHREAQPSDAKQ